MISPGTDAHMKMLQGQAAEAKKTISESIAEHMKKRAATNPTAEGAAEK